MCKRDELEMKILEFDDFLYENKDEIENFTNLTDSMQWYMAKWIDMLNLKDDEEI